MEDLEYLFNFVLDNYHNEHIKASRSDPNYIVLVDKIPQYFCSNLLLWRKEMLVTGSEGRGNKGPFPWVCIFNTNITRSAQKGLYITYLFKKDMSGFYLVLMHGISYFEKMYHRKKYEYARKVASYFKNEIGDSYFSKENIDLLAQKSEKTGYGYQETTILSKLYERGNFNNEMLESDFKKMLDIYDEVAGVLAEDNYDYDKAIDKILLDFDSSFTPAIEAIEEINKEVSSPIDVDVTRRLIECTPVAKSVRKYSKLRNAESVKKKDYIQKAKDDAEIGELGEKLALEHELERLNKMGLSEYASKVRRVSIKSDAFGYDIESYDMIGAEVKKIYIEVKTTVNKIDVDFQVSRNEVETSKKIGNQYYVFRIYDVKNINPKFYLAKGPIEDNFELNPITYMAHYKAK